MDFDPLGVKKIKNLDEEIKNDSIPSCFISYSHDSNDHKDWVRRFAADLRKSRIDVRLDQWDIQPGDDLFHYMENIEYGKHEKVYCFIINSTSQSQS